MAELKPDMIAASSCCSSEAQWTCCEPSEKAGCCGEGGGSCGCSAGEESALVSDSDAEGIRETVREKYAAAARAVAEQQGRASCCGPIALTDADETYVFGAALYDDAETDGATDSRCCDLAGLRGADRGRGPARG